MEIPSCAVVILNWNGEKLLRKFLPSVVANAPAHLAKVIVADNGSTDGSTEFLTRDFPSVELLEFPKITVLPADTILPLSISPPALVWWCFLTAMLKLLMGGFFP